MNVSRSQRVSFVIYTKYIRPYIIPKFTLSILVHLHVFSAVKPFIVAACLMKVCINANTAHYKCGFVVKLARELYM